MKKKTTRHTDQQGRPNNGFYPKNSGSMPTSIYPETSRGNIFQGDESSQHLDWFFPAIESSGPVSQCLESVLAELEVRSSFVKVVQSRLAAAGIDLDSISGLAQKVRALENTLKVRLGILSPERESAWFRVSVSHNAGPFAPTLLSEAIFYSYDRQNVDQIKLQLSRCWDNKQTLPSDSKRQCLWSMLLSLANQLEKISALPRPFHDLRLDILPDDLPSTLESASLRAFLFNVRNEIQAVAKKIEQCHEKLLVASEKFWAQQIAQNTKDRADRIKSQVADDMRAKFKRRRQKARSTGMAHCSTADQESLFFMGFLALPTAPELKKRYIDLAKKHHPDREGGDEAAFKQLSHAYAHLSGRLSRSISQSVV